MTILFISSNLTGLDTPVVATIMKGGHLRGACRPRRPFPNGLSRLPSPPLDSFRRREWEASFASGRSAVWRRAARPCTLGRPGVQVAKGSPVLGFFSEARAFESVSVGGPLPGWLALTSPAPLQARDRLDFTFFSYFFFLPTRSHRERDQSRPPSSHTRETS